MKDEANKSNLDFILIKKNLNERKDNREKFPFSTYSLYLAVPFSNNFEPPSTCHHHENAECPPRSIHSRFLRFFLSSCLSLNKNRISFLSETARTRTQPITTYILFHDKNGNVS